MSGIEQWQGIVTGSMVAVGVVAALYCDYLRARAERREAERVAPDHPVAIAASAREARRGSRLAEGLKQGRRTLSPGAQAAIARGSAGLRTTVPVRRAA